MSSQMTGMKPAHEQSFDFDDYAYAQAPGSHGGGIDGENAFVPPRYRAFSKYNDKPGTGKTGYFDIPPNNYPFYMEEEKYCPKTTRDGANVTEWTDPYEPTPEQEAEDRQKAFEAGIPHGEYVYRKRYGDCPILSLLVTSELHTDTEYGGPFWIHVPSKIRVSDLRDYIRDRSGIMPGLMKLAYRGQSLDDESRKLEHYGVRYWNKKFPDWPLVIKR